MDVSGHQARANIASWKREETLAGTFDLGREKAWANCHQHDVHDITNSAFLQPIRRPSICASQTGGHGRYFPKRS
jgi:hypothetical protein